MAIRVESFNIHSKRGLEQLLKAFDTELDQSRTVVNECKTLVNDIRAKLKGDYTINTPALAIGSTPANVASIAFDFVVNGIGYKKAAVAAGTALSGDNIPQAKYGVWGLDIGINGTIDITEGAANATGYDSAVLAEAGLPAVAADHARMGWVTASKSDGVFDPGTTSLADAAVTEAYTNAPTVFEAIGSAVASSITEQVES